MRKEASNNQQIPLLSIAIPAYNRPDQLDYALRRFVEQISGIYDEDVEIIITDDKSTDETPQVAERYAREHSFIEVNVNPDNIGLERSLINCTRPCRGKYLWIFGDDDFLECDTSLSQIMTILAKGAYALYILNRTRRNKDLSRILSDNWMGINPEKNYKFGGLRQFCLKWGLISIIGFISVNIFARKKFMAVNSEKYMGTMYPQLGMMLEAFDNSPCLLMGQPLICHRTPTMEEKRAELGDKQTEKDFMSDTKLRNATYFSHPFVSMVSELVRCKCFTYKDIVKIPENTVINGRLIDFLINCVELSHELNVPFKQADWANSKAFLDQLKLTIEQRDRVSEIWESYKNKRVIVQSSLTFSVITPSFNQAAFLAECLTSVQQQTYKPIEHFVFDPGSTDSSREIASSFLGVTLVAEEDEGQSDAVNKGFQRARGDIIAWLNSDDCFYDETVFHRVAQRFEGPDKPDIVYGKGVYIDEFGSLLRDVYINSEPDTLPWRLQQEDGILQPALFMRREVVEKIGLLTPHRHYCMDYEFWIRCVKKNLKFVYLDENLALARYHSANKTYGMRGKSYADVCDMLIEQFGYVNHIWLRRYAEFLAEGFDGVLAHAYNRVVSQPEHLEEQYKALLKIYNTNATTIAQLLSKSSKKGYGDTLREMKNLGIGQSTPCKMIPPDLDYEPGYVSYTVGSRRWAFDAGWKKAQIEKTHAYLRKFQARRKSDVCVIVGNGPSLNKTNLDLLDGHDVIISNNAFLSPKLLKHATYYTVVNYLVAEQSLQNINRLENIAKLVPYWLAYCLNEGDNTYFIDAVGYPEFSTDIFKNVSWRHTVSFYNLHIAYGLGYRKVILIGFDHRYRQDSKIKEGEVVQSNESDNNHFNRDYFRGKKWQAADVDMMEEMYALAKAAFEKDGRQIVNATDGGCLELFPRQSLEEALAEAFPVKIKSMPRAAKSSIRESDLVFVLHPTPPEPGVMIELGTDCGKCAKTFVEDGWRIFCLELDVENRSRLVMRLGDCSNVSIDAREILERPEYRQPFYTSTECTGTISMLASPRSRENIDIADITTIEHIVEEQNLTHINFLKIDVEWSNFGIIDTIPWDRLQPDVIQCEFENSKTSDFGQRWRNTADYLVDKGYTIYVSEWYPIISREIRNGWRCLKQYPCELDDPSAWGNLLAFKNDPLPTMINAALGKVLQIEKSSRDTDKPIIVSESDGIDEAKKQTSDADQKTATNSPACELETTDNKSYIPKNHSSHLSPDSSNPSVASNIRFFNRVGSNGLTLLDMGKLRSWMAGLLKRKYIVTMFGLGAFLLLMDSILNPSIGFYRPYVWTLVGIVAFTFGGAVFGYRKIRRLRQRISRLYQQGMGTEKAVKMLSSEIVGLRSQLQRLDASRRETGELSSQIEELWSHARQLDGALQQTQQVSYQIEELSSHARQLDASHKETVQLISQIAKLEPYVQKLDASIKKTQDFSESLSVKTADLAQGVERLAAAVSVPNSGDYQPFNRKLTNEHIEVIQNGWAKNLGIEVTPRSLFYLAHRIRTLENNLKGRLATTIEDAVLRILVATSAKSMDLKVLEIGTLFGTGLAMLYDYSRRRFDSVHLTAIDPLDGYYKSDARDVVTDEIVNEELFRDNLAAASVPETHYTLIKAMSTDDIAVQLLGKTKYDALIIDGDHSLAGVKSDFTRYSPFVKRGGYIIFDDYDSSDWPDVKAFVDNDLLDNPGIEFVGASWRTAVFRVVAMGS